MRDLETENLLYKYFVSDASYYTDKNVLSFEFEPLIFTTVGEIKTLSFIPKLPGSVYIIVSNPGSGSGKYTVNISDDEGKNLIENSTVNYSMINKISLTNKAY